MNSAVFSTSHLSQFSHISTMDLGITSFYEGKSVLITGATGFIGKALVEKLLRSCPRIKYIYILIRPKKGLSSKQRWEKIIIENEIFGIIRTESPSSLDKIVPIDGDVTEEGLGINSNQKKMLENVSIIFHTAASVRFDDSLKYATNVNVIGTKRIVDLALDLKYLISFVHVSTAYCNCHLSSIEEKMYPSIADWRKTCQIVSKTDPIILESLSSKYIHPMPNTYVFAKNLAEQVVNDARKRLPVVIFRPSVVIGAAKEPVPGWVDNFNGPVGLVSAVGKGMTRTACMNLECRCDWIPVDISVKALIASGWRRSWSKTETDIYNCASNYESINNKTFVRLGLKTLDEMPSAEMIWYPSFTTTACYPWFRIKAAFSHFLLAFIVDWFLKIAKKESRLMKSQIKIHRAVQSLSYFMNNEWDINNKYFLELNECIKPADRDFKYSIKNMDFDLMFHLGAKYGRRVLLGEPDSTIPQGLKNKKRWYIVDKVFKYSFIATMCYALYNICSLKFL